MKSALKSGDAANTDGTPQEPSQVARPPDRPSSANSPLKNRTVKPAAKGVGVAPSLSDTLDTTSGASTVDTATPGMENMSSSDMTGCSLTDSLSLGTGGTEEKPVVSALSKTADGKKKPTGTRVSLDQQCLSRDVAAEDKRNTWSKGSCAASHERLKERMSIPGDHLDGDTCRDVLNFVYVKAEQAWLWGQMQRRASLHASSGEKKPMDADMGAKAAPGGKRIVRHSVDKSMLDDLNTIDESSQMESRLATGTMKEGVIAASPKGECVVRRQSVFILKVEDGEDEAEERGDSKELTKDGKPVVVWKCDEGKPAGNKSATPAQKSSASSTAYPEKSATASDASNGALARAPDGARANSASAAPPAQSGKNPLKQLICVKKVDLDQVRAMITRLPDAHMWIDHVMDPGPPLVPRPVVYAIAHNDPGLVELLVELDADITKPYDGPSMYKGWIKPGTPLVQCVQNRKGRFVGTMLADRLTQIEMTIHKALHEQAQKAGKDEPEEEEQEHEDDFGEEPVSTQEIVRSDGSRRKSVAIKTDTGVMRHTQGHPSDIYEVLEHLGDGDTSSCWEGWHKETKVPCAIKAEMKSDEAWLWEEINIMRKVDHPNIVKLYETFENDSQVFMVLELCEGGRLFDKVVAVEHCNFRCARLAGHLASAVNYLHCKSICHRDIQLDNFLLLDDRPLEEAVVKLIDFTTAKAFGPNEPPMKTKICTPGYVAKEILSRKEVPYTEKVDIWSLGVVYFIMICGSPPFYGETDFEVLKKVKKGNFKFEPEHIWANVPDKARDLVNRMICKSEDRLSAAGVTAHPWLSLPS